MDQVMSGFIEGESRYRITLFPESLDEYIAADGAVRVVDVFVDEPIQRNRTDPSMALPTYHLLIF
jgi:hypothetical protein